MCWIAYRSYKYVVVTYLEKTMRVPLDIWSCVCVAGGGVGVLLIKYSVVYGVGVEEMMSIYKFRVAMSLMSHL